MENVVQQTKADVPSPDHILKNDNGTELATPVNLGTRLNLI